MQHFIETRLIRLSGVSADHPVDFADLAGRRSSAHDDYEEPRAAWLDKLEVGRDHSHV